MPKTEHTFSNPSIQDLVNYTNEEFIESVTAECLLSGKEKPDYVTCFYSSPSNRTYLITMVRAYIYSERDRFMNVLTCERKKDGGFVNDFQYINFRDFKMMKTIIEKGLYDGF